MPCASQPKSDRGRSAVPERANRAAGPHRPERTQSTPANGLGPLRRPRPPPAGVQDSSGTPTSSSAASTSRRSLLQHRRQDPPRLVRLRYGCLVQRRLVLQTLALAAPLPGFALPCPAPARTPRYAGLRPWPTCPGGTGAGRCGARWRRRQRRWRWGVRGVRGVLWDMGLWLRGWVLHERCRTTPRRPASRAAIRTHDLRVALPDAGRQGESRERAVRPTAPSLATSRAGRVRAAWRRRRALPGGRVRGRDQSQHGPRRPRRGHRTMPLRGRGVLHQIRCLGDSVPLGSTGLSCRGDWPGAWGRQACNCPRSARPSRPSRGRRRVVRRPTP